MVQFPRTRLRAARLALATGLFALAGASAAAGSVIDFNDLAHDGDYVLGGAFSSGGYVVETTLDPAHPNWAQTMGVWGRDYFPNGDPGGATVFQNWSQPVRIRKADNTAFDFGSIFVGGAVPYPGSGVARFDVLTTSGLQSFERTVSADGMTRLVFNLTGVLEITAQQTGAGALSNLQFDNLLIGYDPYRAPVPEPYAWTLLIVGFGLTGAGLRRRAPAPVAVRVRNRPSRHG